MTNYIYFISGEGEKHEEFVRKICDMLDKRHSACSFRAVTRTEYGLSTIPECSCLLQGFNQFIDVLNSDLNVDHAIVDTTIVA